MTKCPTADELALYIERDENISWPRAVEEHLADCEYCRGLVAALEQDRVVLQLTPALAPEDLARVREGVLAGISARRTRVPIGFVAIAAALTLAVLVPLLRTTRTATPPQEMERAHAVEPQSPSPIAAEGIEERPRPVRRISVGRVTRPSAPVAEVPRDIDERLLAEISELLGEASTPAEPASVPLTGAVVITMQTADPNVMIVLLSESTGGAE